MSGDAKYFQTTKKGEIRELQDDLNSTNKDKIKDAVKKVIAAMTVGKDVSMLFSDVIKSMGTDNIELKKLIYLYIINYARSQPEKAILVVNIFQKDATNHPNPLVRALAIRTMGCIRVDRITEYLCDPLYSALKDSDPYVRKTAAICVAKLYDINSQLVEERNFIQQLRSMLSDRNAMVVANAVAALTEISEASGIDHFKIDKDTLMKLLTAVNECTEWGTIFILDALSKFEAKGTVARDICDRVVPQLNHANSAVVMAAAKVIIRFLDFLPKKEDVSKFAKKLAAPLVTLLLAQPEIQYVALRNIDLIVQKYPKMLQNEIRVFFVKFNDAIYVKMQKLEILIKLANKQNFEQVLMEFKEYAQEIDVEFVRRAVRAIGRVAIKLEAAAERCVAVLSELVKMRVSYVVQECVIVIKDIFRRYPRKYEKIIVALCENLDTLDEPEAKASMIWIIGEYADRIADADERLSHFIDSFEEEQATVQLQLVTATVKLFLKKPDKSKGLVQKVLNLATENSDNPDLRDRGYVYWRLLSTDPAAAKSVVLAERPVISSETFSLPKDYLSELLDNISTLASVYHRPPGEFVRGANKVTFRPYHANKKDAEEEEEEEEEEGGQEEEDGSDKSEHEGSDDEKGDSSQKKKKKDKDKEKEKDKKSTKSETDTPKDKVTNNGSSSSSNNNTNTTKQEPIVDNLLGDLFSAPQQKSTTTNNNNNNSNANDVFDMFGTLSTSTTNNNTTTTKQPSLRIVLDANNGGNGLQLGFDYKNNNGNPVMLVEALNKTDTNITRIDVKFNKNYLGIQPELTLHLNSPLTPNSSQIYESQLKLAQPPVVLDPLNTKVEIAVRSVRTGQPDHVAKFSDKIPPHIFFEVSNIGKDDFANEWKTLSQENQQQEVIKSIKGDVNSIKQTFSQNNSLLIAERVFEGKGIALYFATKLKDTTILTEVSVSNAGSGRVVVKSKDKWLSLIVLQTVVGWLN